MVRIRSGMAKASSRGRTATRTSRCGGQLGVDGGLDGVHQVARHPLELEVHPAGPGLHVAARHERAVVAPDDAAQRVQRRMGPHQRQPPGPLDVDLEDVADRRRAVRRRLQLVGDLAAELARRPDGPGPAVGRPEQDAAVRWLAAAARVERRAIEDDLGRLALDELRHPRLDLSGVGVRVAELLAGRGHFGGHRPFHAGMDGADEQVGTGRERRHVVDLDRDAVERLAREDDRAVLVALVDDDVVGRARVLVVEVDLERGGRRDIDRVCSNLTPKALIRTLPDAGARLGGRLGRAARRRCLGRRRGIGPGRGLGGAGHEGQRGRAGRAG